MANCTGASDFLSVFPRRDRVLMVALRVVLLVLLLLAVRDPSSTLVTLEEDTRPVRVEYPSSLENPYPLS